MKKFIMMIVAVVMTASVFAATKVKVHCEEGDAILTYIYNLDKLSTDDIVDDGTLDKYLEDDIEYVSFKDGIMLCLDRNFKQGTWALEATEMVKDNPDIYVSANFVDAILIVFPYKGHIITISVPRE